MPKAEQTIEIKCDGSGVIELDDLVEFQGELKETDPEREGKLRASILEHGFAVPVIVWKKELMDGHRRRSVLLQLRAEGWTVPPLPFVRVKAGGKKKAAELVLQINSRYGEITRDGLEQFVSVHGLPPDMLSKIHLPGLDLSALPTKEETEARLQEIAIRPPPAMVWILIGIPAGDYGRVTKELRAISKREDVIYEQTIR